MEFNPVRPGLLDPGNNPTKVKMPGSEKVPYVSEILYKHSCVIHKCVFKKNLERGVVTGGQDLFPVSPKGEGNQKVILKTYLVKSVCYYREVISVI